ncbi:MAG: flagellar export chaperone FliS [Thermodesulfobacteriota bacterium]
MAYAGLGAYSKVATAVESKERILLKLLEGAIRFLGFARNGMELENPRIKGESISRVIDILTELDCALDREVGGELAQNLSALYRYMMYRLTLANLRNDAGILDEVETVICQIKEGFEGAIHQRSVVQPSAMGTATGTYAQMTKGLSVAA